MTFSRVKPGLVLLVIVAVSLAQNANQTGAQTVQNCSKGQLWDDTSKSCQCVPGSGMIGSQCQQSYICNNATNAVPGSSPCVCKSGMYLIDVWCIPTPDCGTDGIWDPIHFKCNCRNTSFLAGQVGLCRPKPICAPGLVVDTTSGSCVCPSGFTMGANGCSKLVSCDPVSQILNTVTGLCDCKDAFFFSVGKCLPVPNCPLNSQFDKSTAVCSCVPNTISIKGQCMAPPTCHDIQLFDFINGVCVCPDPTQQIIDSTGMCACKNPSFFLLKGMCFPKIECKDNEVADLDHGVCVCKPGTIWIGGSSPGCQIPIKCADNQFFDFNSASCQCVSGFMMDPNSKACVQAPTCNVGQVIDATSLKCICAPNFTNNNGTCIAQVQCGQNQVKINDTTCKCMDNFLLVNGNCLAIPKCGTNQVVNNMTASCVCQSGFVNSPKGCIAQVQCSTGEEVDLQNNVCKCGIGHVRINGVCTLAPLCKGFFQVFDQTTNQCVCMDRFIMLSNGQCSPKAVCTGNQIINMKNGFCECPIGTIMDSASLNCIPAPTPQATQTTQSTQSTVQTVQTVTQTTGFATAAATSSVTVPVPAVPNMGAPAPAPPVPVPAPTAVNTATVTVITTTTPVAPSPAPAAPVTPAIPATPAPIAPAPAPIAPAPAPVTPAPAPVAPATSVIPPPPAQQNGTTSSGGCGQNELLDSNSGICNCLSGFIRYDGVHCRVPCGKQSFWSTDKNDCVCNWGLKMNAKGDCS